MKIAKKKVRVPADARKELTIFDARKSQKNWPPPI
jgi:hypothetical protein